MAKTIAIPNWNGRVSPLFDTALSVTLVEIENNSEVGRMAENIQSPRPEQRVELLVQFDVETLICGAISRPLAHRAQVSGIQVIGWITGQLEKVLAAYLTGQLPADRFMMPGRITEPWREHHSRNMRN
ncbi:MAG: hypothetical protein KGZ25_09930 [Planctomycetes bacterium]|nr:hypothetical protein [Planctomycetota bacterium]